MESTDKEVCNILADVAVAHGVRRVVISPGSRNAPLVVALARRAEIGKYVIVDERSAAFAALGMSQQLGEPVMLVCTSGTAVLNYAPAIAEAYYQKLPLIVVSADRPKEWIDQDDSQTIRQFEVLSQFVKKSYDIPARCDDDTARWYANRIVNDAMIEALSGRRAPVHINVQLDEPLARLSEYAGSQRIIETVLPSQSLSDNDMDTLLDEAGNKNILVIAGFGGKDSELEYGLDKLASLPNVAVLTETIANLHSDKFIKAVDRTLLAMERGTEDSYKPDLLITVGGAIVSRIVKTFLRKHKATRQWYVGVSETTVDCMQTLTKRIHVEPGAFFRQFADFYVSKAAGSNYAEKWHALADRGKLRHCRYLDSAGWSDLKAFSKIIPSLPDSCRVQLSNGTTIRYAQLFGDLFRQESFCNRGVSGIDGSTSTALGASLAYDGATVLITGDMSFSYDLSGLASQYNSPRLKIIVMCNGGGGIFRFIKSTSVLPELERYFEVGRAIPVDKYAGAFGFKYFEACSEDELGCVLSEFWSYKEKAAVLAVKTDNVRSAETLRNYFRREK